MPRTPKEAGAQPWQEQPIPEEWDIDPTTETLQEYALEQAKKFQLKPSIFLRQLRQESGLRHVRATGEIITSGAGAIGAGQLMPGTAAGLGVNPYQPGENITGAAKYLNQQLRLFKGDYRKALAAYVSGPGNVRAAEKAAGEGWEQWLYRNLRSGAAQQVRSYLGNILGGGAPQATVVKRMPTAQREFQMKWRGQQRAMEEAPTPLPIADMPDFITGGAGAGMPIGLSVPKRVIDAVRSWIRDKFPSPTGQIEDILTPIDEQGRVRYMADAAQVLPMLIQAKIVTDLPSLEAYHQTGLPEALTDEDKAELAELIASLRADYEVSAGPVTREAVEAASRKIISPPVSTAQMATEELRRVLTRPAVRPLPEGAKVWRERLVEMGLDERVADIDPFLAHQLGAQWEENKATWEANRELLKKGIIPGTTSQKAFRLIWQAVRMPMQPFLDAYAWWDREVFLKTIGAVTVFNETQYRVAQERLPSPLKEMLNSYFAFHQAGKLVRWAVPTPKEGEKRYPWEIGGKLADWLVHQLTAYDPGKGEVLDHYYELVTAGQPWHEALQGSGAKWREVVPFLPQLAGEIVFDPANWIEVGLFSKLVGKVPGFAKFAPAIRNMERGFVVAEEALFLVAGKLWRKVPWMNKLSLRQRGRRESWGPINRMVFGLGEKFGIIDDITPAQTQAYLDEAIDLIVKEPAGNTLKHDVGRDLRAAKYVDEDTIVGMRRALEPDAIATPRLPDDVPLTRRLRGELIPEGSLGEESILAVAEVLDNINSGLYHTDPDEAITALMYALGMHADDIDPLKNPKARESAQALLDTYMARRTATARRLISTGEPGEILLRLRRHFQELYIENIQSAVARSRYQRGVWGAIVEGLDTAVVRTLGHAIDNIAWGMAKRTLTFPLYQPLNVIETAFRAMDGGGALWLPSGAEAIAAMPGVQRVMKVLGYEIDVLKLEAGPFHRIFQAMHGLPEPPVPPSIVQAALGEQKAVPTLQAAGRMLEERGMDRYIRQIPLLGRLDKWAEDKFLRSFQNLQSTMRAHYIVTRQFQHLTTLHPKTMELLDMVLGDLPKGISPRVAKAGVQEASEAILAGDLDRLPLIANSIKGRSIQARQMRKVLDKLPNMPPQYKWMIENEIAQGRLPQLGVDGIDEFFGKLKTSMSADVLYKPEKLSQSIVDWLEALQGAPPQTVTEAWGYLGNMFGFQRQMRRTAGQAHQELLKLTQMTGLSRKTKDAMHDAMRDGFVKMSRAYEDAAREALPGIGKFFEGASLDDLRRFERQRDALEGFAKTYRQTHLEVRVVEAQMRPTWPGASASRAAKDKWWYDFLEERWAPWEKNLPKLTRYETTILGDLLPRNMRKPTVSPEGLTWADIASALQHGDPDALSRNLWSVGDQYFMSEDDFLDEVRIIWEHTGGEIHPTFEEEVRGLYRKKIEEIAPDPSTVSSLTPVYEELEQARKYAQELWLTRGIANEEAERLAGYLDEVHNRAYGRTVSGEPLVAVGDIQWEIPEGWDEPIQERLVSLINRLPEEMRDVRRVVVESVEGAPRGVWQRQERTLFLEGAANDPKNWPTIVHELGHSAQETALVRGQHDVFEEFAEIMSRSERAYKRESVRRLQAPRVRGLPVEEHYKTFRSLHESMAEGFENYVLGRRAGMGEALGENLVDEAFEFFERHFPIHKETPLSVAQHFRTPEWRQARMEAWEAASKDYFAHFPDYDNLNALDDLFQKFFPFWIYEKNRWTYLPRLAARRPGTMGFLARYDRGTDKGYIPAGRPFSAIQFNLLRGSVFMGMMSRLRKEDYPEYYEALGPVAGILDQLGRWGFYPNAPIQSALSLFGGVGPGARPQIHETLPPMAKLPFDVILAAMPESRWAKLLYNQLVPDRFREYIAAQYVGAHSAEYNWQDLLAKRQTNQPFTPEEEEWWARGIRAAASYSLMEASTGMLRYREPDLKLAKEYQQQLAEEYTGVPVEVQQALQDKGLELSDFVKLGPIERRLLLSDDYARKYWGLAQGLAPPSHTSILTPYRQFQRKRSEIMERAREQGFPSPRTGKPWRFSYLQLEQMVKDGELSLTDYQKQYGYTRDTAYNQIDALYEVYPGIPKTLEERREFFERVGRTIDIDPFDAILEEYYNIRPEWTTDPLTGREQYDWTTYYFRIGILRGSLSEDVRETLDEYLRMEATPLQRLRVEASQEFLRAYQRRYDKVLELFGEDDRVTIRLWLQADGERRAHLRQENKEVIGEYEQRIGTFGRRLRMTDPEMDAHLVFWEDVSGALTPQAEGILAELRKRFM